MRTFLTITAAAVSIVASFASSHCHAQWPGTTRGSQHTHWLEIGGRAYSRPGTDLNIPLISDAMTGETLFTASQATNGGSAPGLEISFGFEGPLDRQWEFRSILADFNATSNVPGPGLESPLFPASSVLDFNYEYDSRLFSFELNAWRSLAPGIRFSAGPRYVSLTDTVTTDLSGVTPTGPIGQAPLIPLNTVSTREASNGLIGLQAGLDLRYQIAQQLYTTGFIRTGGYYNPTEVSSSLNSFSNGALFDSEPETKTSKSTGSFLAEVGGRIYVDLYEDSIAAYVGYEATWIDGIALAPTAFLSDPAAGVETANTLFFHAVTFGLRMNF